jgi:hypothetical protein
VDLGHRRDTDTAYRAVRVNYLGDSMVVKRQEDREQIADSDAPFPSLIIALYSYITYCIVWDQMRDAVSHGTDMIRIPHVPHTQC